jgi:hypothetical protein
MPHENTTAGAAAVIPTSDQAAAESVHSTLESALGGDTTFINTSIPATEVLPTAPVPAAADVPHISLHSQSYTVLDKHTSRGSSKPASVSASPPPESTAAGDVAEDESHKLLTHISPRPASVVSLTQAPRLETILQDPLATSVDPLASSAATVLGLGDLVASKSHVTHHHAAPAATHQLLKVASSDGLPPPTTQVAPDVAGSNDIPTLSVSLGPSAYPEFLHYSGGLKPHPPAPRQGKPAEYSSTAPGDVLPQRWPSSLHPSIAGIAGPAEPPARQPNTYYDVTEHVSSSASQHPVNRSGSVPTRARMRQASGAGKIIDVDHTLYPMLSPPSSRPGSGLKRDPAAYIIGAMGTGTHPRLVAVASNRSGSVPKSMPSSHVPGVVGFVSPPTFSATMSAMTPSAITHASIALPTPATRSSAPRSRIQVHSRVPGGGEVTSPPGRAVPSSSALKSPVLGGALTPQPPSLSQSPRQLSRPPTSSSSRPMTSSKTAGPERARTPLRPGLRPHESAISPQSLRMLSPTAVPRPSPVGFGYLTLHSNSKQPAVFAESDIMDLVSAAVPSANGTASGSPAVSRPGTGQHPSNSGPSLRELLTGMLPNDAYPQVSGSTRT